MINTRFLSAVLFGAGAILTAGAHSVAFEENFNGDYSANFPVLMDLDHLPPLNNFRPIFTDSQGVAQPWWKIKDSSASTDGFLASHSAYLYEGASNDWVVSRPIEIPTTGYTLTFGAQSYVMRDGDRLSDLRVYISETEITNDNLPSEPTMLIEKVSEGRFPEDIEKDFTDYELNLDAYAGKTVWLAFANLNDQKDILVIDNILIQRLDLAELTASGPQFAKAGDYTVAGTARPTMEQDLTNWVLTFDDGNGEPQTLSGESLKVGESIDFDFTGQAEADRLSEWTVSLTADGMQPVVASGEVQGLLFIPYHRVLLEEATGTWCGNCPMGMYAMESMMEHPEMKDYIVPVSVHISNTGSKDYMENEQYSYLFAVNSAPALRIDRDLKVTYFSTSHDVLPADPDNTLSVAHAVRNRHLETALFSIDVEGKYIINGNDTTGVRVRADISPAMTLPSSRFGFGFILTENNVGLDNNRYWMQENYSSGATLLSDLGGFTKMPEKISNWRFQDVAREVYGYRGLDTFRLPENFYIMNSYILEKDLEIPDTYLEQDFGKGKIVVSPAVVASNLTVIAYILDKENDNRIVNCAAFPLSEMAEKRMSIAQQYEAWLERSDVQTIHLGNSDEAPVYYTLTGIRVENPTNGIYLVKKGNKTEKIVINNQ